METYQPLIEENNSESLNVTGVNTKNRDLSEVNWPFDKKQLSSKIKVLNQIKIIQNPPQNETEAEGSQHAYGQTTPQEARTRNISVLNNMCKSPDCFIKSRQSFRMSWLQKANRIEALA